MWNIANTKVEFSVWPRTTAGQVKPNTSMQPTAWQFGLHKGIVWTWSDHDLLFLSVITCCTGHGTKPLCIYSSRCMQIFHVNVVLAQRKTQECNANSKRNMLACMEALLWSDLQFLSAATGSTEAVSQIQQQLHACKLQLEHKMHRCNANLHMYIGD